MSYGRGFTYNSYGDRDVDWAFDTFDTADSPLGAYGYPSLERSSTANSTFDSLTPTSTGSPTSPGSPKESYYPSAYTQRSSSSRYGSGPSDYFQASDDAYYSQPTSMSSSRDGSQPAYSQAKG
jgi:hypothetical protein